MICFQCLNFDTSVVDSRLTEFGKTVWRRRVCPKCKYKFTTYERPPIEVLALAHVNVTKLQKKSNRLKPNPYAAPMAEESLPVPPNTAVLSEVEELKLLERDLAKALKAKGSNTA
jgi:transcriptional regulator NrdR family protein